jgi:hypothetical protein
MRYAFLLLWLLATVLPMLAQRPVIKVSPAYKSYNQHLFGKHLRSDSTGHYACFYDYKVGGDWILPSEILFEKYDDNLRLVQATKLKAKKDEHNMGLCWFQNRFLWFKAGFDEYERGLLSITPIDRLGEVSPDIQFPPFSISERLSVALYNAHWVYSPDSSKLLFCSGYMNRRPTLFVLDENFQIQWTQSNMVPTNYPGTYLQEAVVDNTGAATLLIIVPDIENGGINPIISRFDAKGENPRDYAIDLKTSAINSINMNWGKNGTLRCAGFYAESAGASTNGVYCFDMDASGNIGQADKKRLTADLLSRMCDDRVDGKRKVVSRDCDFVQSQPLVAADGSSFFLTEEMYQVDEQYSIQGWRTYHTNDVLICGITPEGKIRELRMLPKRQSAKNRSNHLSFIPVLQDNSLVLMYNEHVKNLSKPADDQFPEDWGNDLDDCVPVLTTLHEDGSLERDIANLGQGHSGVFQPRWSRQISPKSVFFLLHEPRSIGHDRIRIGLASFD